MADNNIGAEGASKMKKMKMKETNEQTIKLELTLVVKVSVAVLVALQPFIQNYNPNFVIPMYVAVIADTGLTVVMVLNSLLLLYRKVK